jgi:hypothetical protein
MNNLSRKNHFLPQLYLKAWENERSKIWVHRGFVSRKSVPLWSEKSVSRFGYVENLFVFQPPGSNGETDAVEKYFNIEFENESTDIIRKLIVGKQLQADDLSTLIDFAVSLYARSPDRLLAGLDIVDNALDKFPAVFFATVFGKADSANHLYESKTKPHVLPISTDFNPVEGVSVIAQGDNYTDVQFDFHVGKEALPYIIESGLNAAQVLHTYRWRVVDFPPDISVPVSANPVTILSVLPNNKLSLNNGLASPGAMIIVPISPHQTLYTKVGETNPDTEFTNEQLSDLARGIARNSRFFVASNIKDNPVCNGMSRCIDPVLGKNMFAPFEETT